MSEHVKRDPPGGDPSARVEEGADDAPAASAPPATTRTIARTTASGAKDQPWKRSVTYQFRLSYQRQFKIKAHTQAVLTATYKRHGIDQAMPSVATLQRVRDLFAIETTSTCVGVHRRICSAMARAKPGGDTSYEWKGVTPYKGRYWAYSRDNMERFEREGRLYYSKSGMPSYKRYLDEMPGVAPQDLWTDLAPISPQAAERLGYPTQKPEALLARIIKTSSNEGDVVLDPFCGCGTAIASAQRLNRRWIGIDITQLAVNLIKTRLRDSFGEGVTYRVIGEPVSVPDADALAQSDPYQFQFWALGLVGARPVQENKGADQGIDGRIYFHDEKGHTKQVVLSVKAGQTTPAHVRELRGVVERENAALGVLITMREPTRPMRAEAAAAGLYSSPGWHKSYPRLQLLTVRELLAGKGIDYPPANVTFKKAPQATAEPAMPLPLPVEPLVVAEATR